MHGQKQDGGRRGGKYVCTVPALPRRPVGSERDSAALLENPVRKGSERGRKGIIFKRSDSLAHDVRCGSRLVNWKAITST